MTVSQMAFPDGQHVDAVRLVHQVNHARGAPGQNYDYELHVTN